MAQTETKTRRPGIEDALVLGGAAAIAAGVYLLAGPAWALIAAGALCLGVGFAAWLPTLAALWPRGPRS